MIKLLGSILVVLASSWIGFQLALQYRRRPEQIRHLLSALALFEMEMGYSNRPLYEICQQVAERGEGIVAKIFAASAHNLQQMDGESTFTCLQQAIEQEWRLTAMKSAEKNILLDFSSTLGRSDRSNQVQHINAARGHLQLEEVKARNEQVQYEKMFRTMGVLSGVLIVILLY